MAIEPNVPKASGYGKLNGFLSDFYLSGIAKPNRFEVEIYPPRIPILFNMGIVDHLRYSCQNISIPSQTISTTESIINGYPAISLPYSFSYGNQIDLQLRMSKDYRERNLLVIWQDLIYKPGIGFSYYDEYLGTIIVNALDGSNKVRQKFTFKNCYPVTIQEIGFDWGDTNYMSQGVSFSFYAVESEIVTNSGENNIFSNKTPGQLATDKIYSQAQNAIGSFDRLRSFTNLFR